MVNSHRTARLLTVSRTAALVTIAVMAWHVNFPLNLPQFDTASLPLSYLAPSVSLAELLALVAIVAYLLAGWPNFKLLQSGGRRVFAFSLGGLVLLETLSVGWSIQRGLAGVQAAHVTLWAAFALLIACADWPQPLMSLALLAGLLANSAAGFIEISLQPLVQILPQNSGISVVFNGPDHWQRLYGLSPHPNILGGYLAVGVILIVGLILAYRKIKRVAVIAAWLISWVTLLLTFSRSAWLAVLGGGLAVLIWWRTGRLLQHVRLKPVLVVMGLVLVIVLVFVLSFQPFLANRIEVTTTTYETQAILERVSTAQVALQIFSLHPWLGAGLSQFVVVARDLIGPSIDWVHNVPLLAAAELGLGGVLLIILLLVSLGAIGLQRWRTPTTSVWPILVAGGLIALIVVMQFDHYVWTTPQGGLLWAWLVGSWLRIDQLTAS